MATLVQSSVAEWDEYGPNEAATARGWYWPLGSTFDGMLHHARIGGNYLDYGPNHYRSDHAYCSALRPCRECEPGNISAVLWMDYNGDHDTHTFATHYFPTVAEAREWMIAQCAIQIARFPHLAD